MIVVEARWITFIEQFQRWIMTKASKYRIKNTHAGCQAFNLMVESNSPNVNTFLRKTKEERDKTARE